MEPPTERTFSFTVKIPHSAYVKLLAESREREKLSAAVPSRTARQLIIERLEEVDADKTTPPKPKPLPETPKEETKPVESKKTKSYKEAPAREQISPTRGG